jgi:O-antigen chain-terminating methyltransferase
VIRVLDVAGLAGYGGTVSARCEVRVPEEIALRAEGAPLHLATHVRRPDGELLLHDGPRSQPVTRGEEVLVPLAIPPEPGRYRVEVDPVCEGKFWGSSVGVTPAAFEVERSAEGDLLIELPQPRRLRARGEVFRIPHPGYGLGDSERAVEIPWVLSRYRGERVVVDVGSANAEPRYLHAISALRIPTLVGLDLVPARALRGRAVVADVRRPPLRARSAGLVFAISVIEHVGRDNTIYVSSDKGPQDAEGDFASALALGELLRPGGRLLITVPFGRFQDHGWFIQYDQARLDALVARSGLRLAELELYEYAGGWRGPVDAAALSSRGYREGAVAAAGLACLSLTPR